MKEEIPLDVLTDGTSVVIMREGTNKSNPGTESTMYVVLYKAECATWLWL